MADEAAHRAEAGANRDLAERLLASRPDDPNTLRWAATVTFYVALHLRGAPCDNRVPRARGVTVGSHDDRSMALADPQNGVPNHVFAAYQALRRRSVDARYLVRAFTPDRVRNLIDNQLHEVFRFVGL